MTYWSSIWLTDGRLPAGHRPDITHKIDDRPFTGLRQQYNARPHAQFALPEDLVGGRGNREHGTDTPDQFSMLTRREEERGVHVAKSVLPPGVLVWEGLPHQRLYDAQSPI